MLKVGDKVKVTADKKVRKGTIVYENDYFYTVQFEHYNESFQKTDISNGTAKVIITAY